MALGVITGILMQGCRKKKFNPQIFVKCVGIGMPVIAAITGCTLAKFGIGASCLRNAGLNAHEDKRRIIDAVHGRRFEFFFHRLRRQLLVRTHRPEVWKDVEDALGLLRILTGRGWGRSTRGRR